MSIWNNLLFRTEFPASNTASSYRVSRLFKSDPDFKYVNRRPKSIFVHMGKRAAMQAIEYEVHKLADKLYRDWTDRGWQAKQNENAARQKRNLVQLIQRQNAQKANWGELKLADANHVVFATDKYGEIVKEAIILYYDDPLETHSFKDFVVPGNAARTQVFTTKTWFHIDLAPAVNVSSSKNVVLTQVQGRDYSRKELVSGGDLAFSVSGSIVSNEDGVYPEDAVKKFVKMMQYNGILNVKSFQFNQLGVTRLVIQDFKLGQPTYKNIQPYSFSCVAVEPDEDIVVAFDTIAQANEVIDVAAPTNTVNLMDILKRKALELAADNTVMYAGLGLDEITKNI